MSSRDRYFDIISSIYGVAGSFARWEPVLKEIASLIDAEVGVYFLVDPLSKFNQPAAFFGYTAEHLSLYEGSAAAESDIKIQHINNLLPGMVFTESEYIPDQKAYAENAWTKFDLEARGVYWNMAATVSTHRLWQDIISFNRLRSAGPYQSTDKAALQALLPHISRSAELHRTFNELQQAHKAVLAVLDKLLIGLLIVDHKQRLVIQNNAAVEAAQSNGELILRQGKSVKAKNEQSNLALQRLLSKVVDTANKAGQCEGGRLTLPMNGSSNPLLLEVMPIRDDGLPDGENIRGAAIFVIDPNRSQFLNTHGLAELFSLTTSEKAITDSLIAGLNARDISEERSTGFQTVRGQIKSIYQKTGVNSRADLVRLAAKAEPPIER